MHIPELAMRIHNKTATCSGTVRMLTELQQIGQSMQPGRALQKRISPNVLASRLYFILVYREYQDERHMLGYCGSVTAMLNNSDKKI